MQKLHCSVLLGSLLAANGVCAGMIDLPVEQKSSVFVDIAFARPARPAILDGSARFNQIGGAPTLGNFNNKTEENSYALGAGFWLPCYEWNEFQFNGTAALSYMPYRTVTSVATTAPEPGNPELARLTVKSRMLNITMGLNAIRHVSDSWFVLLGIAGGLSQSHFSGYFEAATTIPSVRQANIDHPGVTTSVPFITGELGIGVQLSSSTKAIMRVQYAHARTDSQVILAEAGSDNGRIFVGQPEHWYQVGLTLSRDINL